MSSTKFGTMTKRHMDMESNIFFQDGHYFQDGHHNIGLLAIMLCIEVINGENMFTMINYASLCETRDVYAFFITGFAVVRSS